MPKPEKTTETGKTEPVEEQTQTADEPKSENNEDGAEEVEQPKESDAEESETGDEEESESGLDLENIQRGEDGSLTLVVNPDDPRSTVYKGKNITELMSNVAKGLKEKDTYINRLKANRVEEEASKFRNKATQEVIESANTAAFPEYGEIVADVMSKQGRQLGVTTEMLGWTDAQWQAYEAENGAHAVMRKSNAVERLNELIESKYAEVNVVKINNDIIADETKAVRELLVEEGIDPDEDGFDFYGLLEKVTGNKDNLKKTGLLKTGSIVAAAAREISKIAKSKAVKTVRKTTDEEQAKSREQRKRAGSVQSGSRKSVTDTRSNKPPKTMEEAVRQATAEWNKRNKGG
jgi:hypothetical protein